VRRARVRSLIVRNPVEPSYATLWYLCEKGSMNRARTESCSEPKPLYGGSGMEGKSTSASGSSCPAPPRGVSAELPGRHPRAPGTRVSSNGSKAANPYTRNGADLVRRLLHVELQRVVLAGEVVAVIQEHLAPKDLNNLRMDMAQEAARAHRGARHPGRTCPTMKSCSLRYSDSKSAWTRAQASQYSTRVNVAEAIEARCKLSARCAEAKRGWPRWL
jgi:hypothetical protein